MKFYAKLFAFYAISAGLLNLLLFDRGVVEGIFGAVFLGVAMTAVDIYFERKDGPRMRAEVERMKSLGSSLGDKKDGKPKN